MTAHFVKDQVYTFKLNSGEEVIGKVTSEGTDWLMLAAPLSVAPGPQGMGLVPGIFTAKRNENIKLNIASVAMYAVTDDEIKDKYIEATTGIRLPEKKLVLG